MIIYGGRHLKTDIGSLDVQAERLSFDDLRDFARRSWPGRLSALGMEWPGREGRVVLNRLTWPIGASNPAIGYFLATDADLAILRPAAYSGGTLTALPLTLDDGKRSFTTYLFMLPPRPLGQCGTGGDQYLLTLVDARYFWDGAAAAITAPVGTTWADLFDAYAAALGISIAMEAVPAAYGTVPAVFGRAYDSIPAQLDAAARAIGMRVVRGTDGSVNVISAAIAAALFAANLTLNPLAAGGLIAAADLGGVLPASVVVVDSTDAPSSVTLASLALPQFSGATTYEGTEILRTPLTLSGGMAAQIARDWYSWRSAPPDVAYNGVCAWVMSGFEDQVEWTHGDTCITTRVQRPPWNMRTEAGIAAGGGDDDAWTEVAVLTSNVPAMTGLTPGSGTAQQYKMVGSSLVNRGLGNIPIYNNSLTISYLSGAAVNLVTEPVSGDLFITGGSLTNITLNQLNFTVHFTTLNLAIYNNINVTGQSKLRFLAAASSPATAVTIHGFAGGVDGQVLIIWNVSATQPIFLMDSSPLAGAGNKIVTPLPSADGYWVLGMGSGVILEYDAIGDGTEGFWRFDESTFMGVNQSASQEAYQCRQILFHDDQGDHPAYNFGRIHGSLGADPTVLTLDWQGVRGYKPGVGYVGPAPDIEVNGDNQTIASLLDLDTGLTIPALRWILTTIGVTGSFRVVRDNTWDAATCQMTTTYYTFTFLRGVCTGVV